MSNQFYKDKDIFLKTGINSTKLWNEIVVFPHNVENKKMIILLIFSVLSGTMPRGIFFVM